MERKPVWQGCVAIFSQTDAKSIAVDGMGNAEARYDTNVNTIECRGFRSDFEAQISPFDVIFGIRTPISVKCEPTLQTLPVVCNRHNALMRLL